MKKRSVTIQGHSTSVTLEDPFWDALNDEARAQKKSINQLISEIDNASTGNLSSAIRLYVLEKLQQKITG